MEAIPYETGVTGAPLLSEALGHLECAIRAEAPAGDHTVFVGEVIEARLRRAGAPLTMAETGFRYFG
jgi:flavin reductase (DIM6/NTAB) family NADH-FMN oxidoreductase RutF